MSTTAPTGANTTKPTTKRPTTTAADSPLAKVEPCELVTASAKDALKITAPGSAEKIGKSRACLWTIPGNTIKDQASLSVALFDTLGIKDIVAKGPVETIPRIGQHEARKWEGKSVEGCVISLEVGPSTRVDVIGTSISPEKACEVATTAAALVEAELP